MDTGINSFIPVRCEKKHGHYILLRQITQYLMAPTMLMILRALFFQVRDPTLPTQGCAISCQKAWLPAWAFTGLPHGSADPSCRISDQEGVN